MSVAEQKAKIRQRLLDKRQDLPEAYYREASDAITDRLVQHPVFHRAGTIHCYVSINKRREVNTHALIRDILDGGGRLVVPVTDFDSVELRHIRLKSFGDLETNRWGVLEPRGGEEIEAGELDLVIVPMVGGDRSCNRIGYGKGFYDRFLSRTDCPAVGLCFDECIIEEVPTEGFDVALHSIVTQSTVIS